MVSRSVLGLLVVLVVSFPLPARAQGGQPALGGTATFHIDLHAGSNLVSLPVRPDSAAVETVLADLSPLLTLIQDDDGRYFIPSQGIAQLGRWSWDQAYRVVTTGAATLIVQGPEIRPEASPLLVEPEIGNWVPYLRTAPSSVDAAFASIASHLLRVEDARGRFYVPGDAASTLDSVRTGEGYRVWVSQPATLTFPANTSPSPDTAAPARPTGLVATPTDGAIVLDWADSPEIDLHATPYEVLRSTTSGGGYTHVAWRSGSRYTDADDLVAGTAYYYVVTARDADGNVSLPSAEASATLEPPPPPSPSPFALPASGMPTATDEALGMRLEYRDDPLGAVNEHGEGFETQGERLWIGVGGTGTDRTHPLPIVEPDGAGGIQTYYINDARTLAPAPPLGTDIGTDAFKFCHEGTMPGAAILLPSGGTAVHLNVLDGDGGGCDDTGSYFYRYVQPSDGSAGTLETLTKNGGSPLQSGAKNYTLASPDASGPVVLHLDAMSNTSFWTDGDLDGDFKQLISANTSNGTIPRAVGIGSSVYIVANENVNGHAAWRIDAAGNATEATKTGLSSLSEMWNGIDDVSGGYGPSPRYVGPAPDGSGGALPGFIVLTRSNGRYRIYYHDGQEGSTLTELATNEPGYISYARVGDDTWRILNDGRVQRLSAIDPTGGSLSWTTELTLTFPSGWSDVEYAQITENGSIWIIGEKNVTFPATGVAYDDIAVAYYRSAGLE